MYDGYCAFKNSGIYFFNFHLTNNSFIYHIMFLLAKGINLSAWKLELLPVIVPFKQNISISLQGSIDINVHLRQHR